MTVPSCWASGDRWVASIRAMLGRLRGIDVVELDAAETLQATLRRRRAELPRLAAEAATPATSKFAGERTADLVQLVDELDREIARVEQLAVAAAETHKHVQAAEADEARRESWARRRWS